MAREKFERSKPHINIGTIGHVDHGKTTLTAAISATLAIHNESATKKFDEIDGSNISKSGRKITVNSSSKRVNELGSQRKNKDSIMDSELNPIECEMLDMDVDLDSVETYKGTKSNKTNKKTQRSNTHKNTKIDKLKDVIKAEK